MTTRGGADFLQLDARAAPQRDLTGWLAGALRIAIVDGRLGRGDRLPPTRVLAGDLGVSRGVVVEAYRRLAEEGVIAARTRAGTVVIGGAAVTGSIGVSVGPRPGSVAATAGTPDGGTTAVRRSLLPPAAAGVDIDLSPGLPDLSAFPRAAWLRHERRVLTEAGARELGYVDPQGTAALREQLAHRLNRVRGVRASAADIVVVNGVAQALSIIAILLGRDGRTRMAVEDPGSVGAREHLRTWGITTVPVAVDGSGMRTDRLAEADVDAVLLTPAHQFPMGAVLAADRREDVLRWARSGGLVIEDDYDAEMRYDRAPVGALQGLAPDVVIHVGSVSKALAPGLRLGWIVAPESLRDRLVDLKFSLDIGSPGLAQLVLASMLASGDYDGHLRRLRSRHLRRRDVMVRALRAALPGADVFGIQAGLHVVVTFPDLEPGADDEIARRCAAAGVRVHPLSMHRCTAGAAGLVIGYAANGPTRLEAGVAAIGRAVAAGARASDRGPVVGSGGDPIEVPEPADNRSFPPT